MLKKINPLQFKGQFIFTAEQHEVPGWNLHTYNEWKLFTSHLPVIDVFDSKESWIGWCIGHPIVDGVFTTKKIIIQDPSKSMDPYEDYYNRTSGKWILFLIGAENTSIYLDPLGSLATVYSTVEKTVASTPTLIGSDADWDNQLMFELNFPEKVHWLPSGLTFKQNVSRLQANHRLNLSIWKKERHWPTPETDFSIYYDVTSAVNRIKTNIEGTLNAIREYFPLCLTLTGGMDSRMVLACARNHIQDTKIITFAGDKDNLDVVLAKRLTKQINLNHEFLKLKQATKQELDEWQLITGKSVAGGIWKIHNTLKQLDTKRVFISGQSCEIHKGNYWSKVDIIKNKVSASDILLKCKLPLHPTLIKATEDWLLEIKYLKIIPILDLVHIEQRLSCWGALQAYGNTTSAFEMPPSSNRETLLLMMKLPYTYRKKKLLVYDICNRFWPDLLKLPFNEYPGIYGYSRNKAKIIKQNFINTYKIIKAKFF